MKLILIYIIIRNDLLYVIYYSNQYQSKWDVIAVFEYYETCINVVDVYFLIIFAIDSI